MTHTRMRMLATAAALALAAGAMTGVVAGTAAAQERDARVEQAGARDSIYTWRGRVEEGAWLRVMAFSGTVEVRAASGDVAEVRAEKRLRGDRGDLEDISFEIRRSGGNVTICALWRDSTECRDDGISTHGNTRSASVRFTVLLPRGVRVKASSGNGDVSVQGATAEVVATSGNGAVDVAGSAGPVRASSGNGEVTVEGATAGVQVSTGNGSVRVSTSAGPVSASSGNGDIYVRMASLRGEGDMDFRTGNGLVRVTLPADFEGEVETTQGQGSLRTDFPLTIAGRMTSNHVRATIGRGGRRIRMVSGNGNLELRKGP